MSHLSKPALKPESEDDGRYPYDLPPPYELHSTGEFLDTSTAISDDGRVNISFSSRDPAHLARLLPSTPPAPLPAHEGLGDVQPFIAYGTALRRYGHRVRLATHNNFADFVRESGLEFYPIGGDPADLMSYMVRNPGLIPSLESLRGGDIGRKRRMIKEMLDGCWEACYHPDPVTNEPFVADAIVANPPSFAHVHCAQALGVPVHIMFTMPWTATKAFPHPLANFQSNNTNSSTANWLSYGVVETMTWQGLGDVINDWRRKSLGLENSPASMGPGITTHLKVPHTYCWSPAIMPKPADWGPEIEWLFKRVSVVVHHGGAGTTACGLVNARPTIIVPFFGDQPFWGGIVASVGAGSKPIPHKKLSADLLVEALRYCLLDEAKRAAQHVSSRMRVETGVDSAVESLHRNLPVDDMACDALPQYAATWVCEKKRRIMKLSDRAAATLIAEKKLKVSDLVPLRVRCYDTDVTRWDPLTGGASSVLGTLMDMTMAFGGIFIDPFKEYKRRRTQPGADGTPGSRDGSAGAAAMAAGKGLGKVYGSMTKGALLDMPLAFTEGLRNVPKLYGAEPDDYGRVTDWKSGAVVGGKALGLGLYNSVTGLVTEPYKGAKKEGAVGFMKGVGKGSVELVTNHIWYLRVSGARHI
ncbi:UDP-glucose,sterol transferase [Verticillium dahliae VdLs.17]|uniref:UDP-glucose,sterol transferase n=1 Tax=Verticillium dahliae (strain VdLs.17 / ATCC MYA-4575 / FGSC 10137) TaxID=498257 RepID=G2WXP4_VERDV|nr:UDP-glucose,sterol transferase [Verticillium dahliae VdLs.17]EGY20852.1 UDP-glucose,sterol transferase [Verticillium dahliae VdLs.17]